MSKEIRDSALEYHQLPTPGKLSVVPTKPLANQRDLALAYSPGVAFACENIHNDPQEAAKLTSRANLVAVVTNGTAVLGLGAIGPLAAKPVMEGKAVLFKKFAGIDVFDIEINETNPEKLVDIVASLEPTFGGINLEDIKAPECFFVEGQLKERMNIPVFHDDQHGTAIIVAAALKNALELVNKNISDIKLVASGAGAAALACLDLLVDIGVKREHIWVTDLAGVVYCGREELMDDRKVKYCQETKARTLAEVIEGADVFLGLSGPNVLKPDMLKMMKTDPIIFALANPTPEIAPELAREVRPDAIIATGRSDFPNQVNNVLCFPYIFRGALDVGATTINEEMKIACVDALANLAKQEQSDIVMAAYGDQELQFGRDYLIPKPFDPRLILELAPAVAKAAMETGVAMRPITDFKAYREQLSEFVFRSGLFMKPIFSRARQEQKRVVYAEGEEEQILRAVQVIVDDGLAKPILIGRPDVIEMRIQQLGLRLRLGEDVEMVNIHSDPRYREYWTLYHEIMERKGVSPSEARLLVRSNPTVIAALMVKRGEADAMICGLVGKYHDHLKHVRNIIGTKPHTKNMFAMSVVLLPKGTFFLCDTHVKEDPSREHIIEMVLLAVEEIKRYGIQPKVALLSHSNFGSAKSHSTAKLREALSYFHKNYPELEIEGEMHTDIAIDEEIRKRIFPNSRLKGSANLLVMPSLDAANITFNALKVLGEGLAIGPILLGSKSPVHIMTRSATVRRLVNMSAIAALEACEGPRDV